MRRQGTAVMALLLTLVLTACSGQAASNSAPTSVTPAPTGAAATAPGAAPSLQTATPATASAGTPTMTTASVTTRGSGAATPEAASGGMSAPQPTAAPPSGESLTVYAAASLTDAFKEIGGLYAEKTGERVDFNFGASNALRTQIEQGAVADVFASANRKEMDTLGQAGLVDGDAAEFAKNRLVIVVPKDNPAKIFTLQDLAKPGVKFVTTQPGVPVGQYTVTALEKMSADPEFGSDFKSKVDANTVSKEENVRAVLSKVALGEADAGVVYVSDVSSAQQSKVTTLEVPDQFNTIASYPIALVKGGPHPVQAREFLELVLAPEGQAVLQKYNFIPARP